MGSAWDKSGDNGHKNLRRKLFNGVRPGDTVKLVYGDTVYPGLIVHRLHSKDIGSCTVIDRRNKKTYTRCEWLVVTKKVEDKT